MPIKLYGTIVIPISFNGWKVNSALFLVPETRTRNQLRLSLHADLRIVTTQTQLVNFDSSTERVAPNHKTQRSRDINLLRGMPMFLTG